MYISAEQLQTSFLRLRSRKTMGKTHLERTSALMYFLAFDATCKIFGANSLDLNPENAEGHRYRKQMELEFTRLVLIERKSGLYTQVLELGKVTRNAKSPEKRISSNFLTVPLKKASDQSTPYAYPRRPTAPLMDLGESASGFKWGISYHENWQNNLPKLLSEIKASTPFTDLAFFIFRNSEFKLDKLSYVLALSSVIRERFSEKLSTLWIERIEKEKVLAKHIGTAFSDIKSRFPEIGNDELESSTREELIDYVTYLEQLLKLNNIKFEPYKLKRHGK